MRTIIFGLCTLILAMTVQNLYLYQSLEAAIKAQEYDTKIINKFSDELCSLKKDT